MEKEYADPVPARLLIQLFMWMTSHEVRRSRHAARARGFFSLGEGRLSQGVRALAQRGMYLIGEPVEFAFLS